MTALHLSFNKTNFYFSLNFVAIAMETDFPVAMVFFTAACLSEINVVEFINSSLITDSKEIDKLSFNRETNKPGSSVNKYD